MFMYEHVFIFLENLLFLTIDLQFGPCCDIQLDI